LPLEWSKFVTDVKLVRDLHTTKFDQLHAYLEQHELYENEVLPTTVFTILVSSIWINSIHRPLLSSTPHPNAYSSTVHQDACPQPQSIPQIEYIVSIVNQQTHLAEFPHIDSGLAVPMFKQGNGPIDAINKMMSFLSTVVTSPYQADDLDVYDSDCDDFSTAKAVLMANLSSYGSDVLYEYLLETQNAAVQDINSSAQQDVMILSVFEQLSNQVTNCNNVNKDNLIANESLSSKLERYKERVKLLEERQNVDLTLGFQNPFYLKKVKHIRPMLYDGSVIAKETNVISIADFEETLMLEEESRSKMLLKQSDPMVLQKKFNTKPINYAELNRLS
ncbi:hypothetical protein Tco_1452888, partial [Tanacetum coccineum]